MWPLNSKIGSSELKRSGPQTAQHLADDTSAQLLPLLALLERKLWSRCRRIALKVKGKILFIDPAQIISVHSEGNYVAWRKDSGCYFLRGTLSETMTKLEPYGFVRIHRSILINPLLVEEIWPFTTGEYGLRIKGAGIHSLAHLQKESEVIGRCMGGNRYFPQRIIRKLDR